MTLITPSRRQFLTGGLTVPCVAALPLCSLAQGALGPFTLGVASGDPASDGFVIWTRLAPDPLAPDGLGGMTTPTKVRWFVYDDEAMSRPVAQGEISTSPLAAHAVHVEVAGLKPDRFYNYRFEALGARSATGRARTLPLPSAKPQRLKLAYASCSHYEKGWFSAYRHMADEDPDYSVFLGDYIYEYSYKKPDGLVRHHEQIGDVRTLSEFRRRYALYRLDADLQALHARTTSLITWDDHEVQNDYGGFLSEYMDDDVNMLSIRQAAYQAFYEMMPLRRTSRLIGTHVHLYKAFRFGDLADITLLDGRQYRSPAACPVNGVRKGHVVTDACIDRLDPKRSMLGIQQEAWLYDRFAKSHTTWNIIAQDLLVASFTQTGRDKAGNTIVGHWTDGWDGYPATRDRLLAAIQSTRLKNPVMLGGDIHSFWATDLKADFSNPNSATIATEFVGTSVTSDGPPRKAFADRLPENPHIKYFNSGTHGYVVAEVTPQQMAVRFRAISDRADPNATVATERAFTVENGRAGVIMA
ncbi:alkaline phosphatase D family protein [Asticcacaulis sp. EMRT-3]|uniref:alkaline phosphatase D family protein n=1 Tax=Asticcacaulis sp. EMRT-3 TaxID=3040349 RepID=UPI0024AFF287|nr:alkaline phosphatase D family protein [Asticcacaulis sp. EMRT-3]MDI7775836.1 alkaline phosphatase D family protein [Asticcacaulis sp. EMRT-3]